MLLVQDTYVKLGGIELPGQAKSIEIQEAASVDEVEDDKGTTKSTQPTGYESAKVIVELLLETFGEKTPQQQIQEIERLFKSEGQQKANLIEIVCEDCAARGISMVYFKNFTTKRIISDSTQMASLELWTPMLVEIQTKKAPSGSGGGSGSSTRGGKGKGSSSGGSGSGLSDKEKAAIGNQWIKDSLGKAKDTIKDVAKSPAAQDAKNKVGNLINNLFGGK